MKNIKCFEDFTEKLYKQFSPISFNDWVIGGRCINFDTNSQRYLDDEIKSDFWKKNMSKNSVVSGNVRKETTYYSLSSTIHKKYLEFADFDLYFKVRIFECPDEYYLLEYEFKVHSDYDVEAEEKEYYICDGLDGVVECIKKIETKNRDWSPEEY